MTKYKNIIEKWLDSAKWAASGGNAQPWKVEYEELDGDHDNIVMRLSIEPTYIPHHSPLDVCGAASALSLGCLSTNIISVAALDDYDLLQQKIFTCSQYWESYVVLQFRYKEKTKKFYLEDVIKSRHTNRTRFSKKTISGELNECIHEKVRRQSALKIFEFLESKKDLMDDFMPFEKLRWQAKSYLESLMDEIALDHEIKLKPTTIPISQLGLSFIDVLFFKFLKKSKLLQKVVQRLFYSIVAKKSLVNFRKHCDRIYLIQAETNSFENCYRLGQTFQEIWLEVEKERMGFQPFGTPLVALGYFEKEPLLNFNKKQSGEIEKATMTIINRYQVDLKLPTIGFRVGVPRKDTSRSPRKELFGIKVKDLLNKMSA